MDIDATHRADSPGTHSAPLAGRIAAITGASAGIGEACARAFVAQGARVVLNARRGDRLDTLCGELNSGREHPVAVPLPGDAADHGVITAMLDAAKSTFGSDADLVVVNAGRGLSGSVATSDDSQWESMIRLNLLGAMRLMRAATERMAALTPPPGDDPAWLERPRDLVVLGSTVGRHISPFSSAYGATKFGVHAAAEALRREAGPKGVRVTLIEPGIVKSEFQGVAGYDEKAFGEFMGTVGPVLTPDDIARSIVFTCAQPAAVHVCDAVIRPTRQEYP